jgi:predicted Zn-dependent protease
VSSPVLTRVLVALVAVVAIAWLGVNLRDYDSFERGERLAFAPNAGQAQVEEAARLLEDSRFLNPDTRPLLAKGALLVARGDGRAREGIALIEEAVRREPDNVFAWGVLASATRRLDPERSRQARARVDELSPPVEPG